ncbi:MAG: cell cycle transcriptional regulator TrcR [Hyphomicrobiales bacterium]
MSNLPLMPKATAVWLVDNTALSFEQIAAFCKLHPLEVKAIADGDSAQGIKGLDPVSTGQLTREEIATGEKSPEYRLKLAPRKVKVPETRRRGPRYTPVSRRQDRPNAILWLLRHHPELKDAQVMRLVGTTKPTIESIKERTHWNSANLTPMDPVSLGLCSQLDLDFEVQKAAKSAPQIPEDQLATLLPATETTSDEALAETDTISPSWTERKPREEPEETYDPEHVFAKLKSIKRKDDDEDEF